MNGYEVTSVYNVMSMKVIDVLKEFVENMQVDYGVKGEDSIDTVDLNWSSLYATYCKALEVIAVEDE